MKELKNILQYNGFYYILLILTILYVLLFHTFIKEKSYYSNKSKYAYGYIINIKKKNDKTSLIIKSKEKLIINYDKSINIKYGDYIKVYGNFYEPAKNTNFDLFNYKDYLYHQKIYYIVNAKRINKTNKYKKIYVLKNYIIKRINKCKKTKQYLKTFILGDKNDIVDYKEKYQKLGVSHLLSISGMHIAILTGILLCILKKLKFKNIIVFVFLLFYLFITGFSASTIRSSLLFVLVLINKEYKLNIKNINILLIIFSFLLIINPHYIYDIGYIFSFTICFFLIRYSNILKSSNYIFGIIKISILSFFVSLPIVIYYFNSVNILSIVLNIIYVPFVSIIVFPLCLITYIFPVFDSLLSFFIKLLELLTDFFSKIPSILYFSKPSLFLIVTYYLFLILLLNNNRKKYYILLCLNMFLFYIYNMYVSFQIHYLDVGQGDSLLFRIHEKNIMIDTGGKFNSTNSLTKKILVPYLKIHGIKKIDYLILSHGDYDHMGESINLVNNFKVEKVIFNCGPYNDLEQELIKVLDKKKIQYYSCIKELNIDNNKLYFLQTREYDNENDNSNVIYTELNGYKFMFMGDASITTEKEITNKYNLPNIDVLKIGHHGSKTSSSKDFINEINPKYSIISVGKNNRYGHPNKEVLENLENSKIYRTDQDGSIRFKIKNNRLMIETCGP